MNININLQLVAPNSGKACLFQCPYCIASYGGTYPFMDNLWMEDREKYLSNLYRVIKEKNVKDIIITGTDEFTITEYGNNWLKIITDALSSFNLELQTHNMLFNSTDVAVIAYSVDKMPKNINGTPKLLISDAPITRTVFILNKATSFKDMRSYRMEQIRYKHSNPTLNGLQMTVKKLQKNNKGNRAINEWIEENDIDLYDWQIKELEDIGVKYDTNCMNGKDRYLIYRADGKLYDDWDSTVSIKV